MENCNKKQGVVANNLIKKTTIFAVALLLAARVVNALPNGDTLVHYQTTENEDRNKFTIYPNNFDTPKPASIKEKKISQITVTEKEIEKALIDFEKIYKMPPYRINERSSSQQYFYLDKNAKLTSSSRTFLMDPYAIERFFCIQISKGSKQRLRLLNCYEEKCVLFSEYSILQKAFGENLQLVRYYSLWDKMGKNPNFIESIFSEAHKKQNSGKKLSKIDNYELSYYQKVIDFLKKQPIADVKFVPKNGHKGLASFLIPIHLFRKYSSPGKRSIDIKKYSAFIAKLLKFAKLPCNEIKIGTKGIGEITKDITLVYIYKHYKIAKSRFQLKDFQKEPRLRHNENELLHAFVKRLDMMNIPYILEYDDVKRFAYVIYPGFVTLISLKIFEPAPENASLIYTDMSYVDGERKMHYIVVK